MPRDPEYARTAELIRRGLYAKAVALFNKNRATFQSPDFKIENYNLAKFETADHWGISPANISYLLQACRTVFDHYLEGSFIGTGLIANQKSAHFLFDEKFADALEAAPDGDQGSGLSRHFGGTVWIKHVVLAAALNALSKEGDFVECGTYYGSTAKAICRYCEFEKYPERTFYLYDLFGHSDGDTHTPLPGLKEGGLYENALETFKPWPNVRVVQGRVPDIFAKVVPSKIAFLHVDMNDPVPELMAYVHLWDRMAPGGIIILDDYGHVGRQDQQMFANAFFDSKGRKVIELPTGQGLLVA
jgi:O-methyltransferase